MHRDINPESIFVLDDRTRLIVSGLGSARERIRNFTDDYRDADAFKSRDKG